MSKLMVKPLLVVVCLLLALSACESQVVSTAPAAVSEEAAISPTEPSTLVTPASAATGQGVIARQHLEALSETIGARLPGTPEEARAAEYIQAAFEEMGYEPQLQAFSFTSEGETLDSANVIAVKSGSSPREIIVGAHYDSSDEAEGADDNASGVAVLLEVAQTVSETATPYTIRFIAFGAEEEDLNGSSYFVQQMSTSDIQNTIGMINLDSLIAGDIAYVYGDTGSPGSIRDWILNRAQERGFHLEARTARELDFPDGTPCDCADYGPFQKVGVPFAYFEATNWNLGEEDGMTQVDPAFGSNGEIRHTRYDTVRYMDENYPGRIDEKLNLFVTLLCDTLTMFNLPS